MSPEVSQVKEHSRINSLAHNKLAVAAVAALAVGGTLIGLEASGTFNGSDATALSTNGLSNECSDFTNTNSAANPNKYLDGAFLPKPNTPVNNPSKATKYIGQIFGSQGPLAGKNGDNGSLAGIMSAVVVPAEQGAISNPNYNY